MNRILSFLGFNGHNNTTDNVIDNVIDINKDKDILKLKQFIELGMTDNEHDDDKYLLCQDIVCLDQLLLNYKYDDILDIITEFKQYPSCYVLYVLAICCSIRLHNDILDYGKDFREDCFKLVLDICKTSFDLFNFVELYQEVNKKKYNSTGWNSSMKKMISKWYNTKTPEELMNDTKNSKTHDKWCHKDVIRLAHVKAKNNDINMVLKYLVKEL